MPPGITSPLPESKTPRFGLVRQFAAWTVGLAVGVVGMLDLIAEWSPALATVNVLLLALAPLGWMMTVREKKGSRTPLANPPSTSIGVDLAWTVLIAGMSLALSIITAQEIGDLPPAYHDEYSYVFQAKTLLAGRLTWPSHPTHAELFDEMHVLNEGRMASRYYPGCGAWLAPWIALGHPYWGHWLAGAASAALLYWIGRDLGGRRTGIIAGLTFAAAPGPALFSNLLLAHHPTLLGLCVFLWAFVRAKQHGRIAWWLLAGCGLSFAMLCRPVSAAGVALPWGLWVIASALRTNQSRRFVPWIGLGIPLIVGWLIMAGYNHAVTGSWTTSPYQLYTDTYTPRHVYGLNNVVRGEQHLGPKVLDDYDRWAENLTPGKAWENTGVRWLASGLWTIDLPLMAMTTVVVLTSLRSLPTPWLLVFGSIVSLHAFHWAYWYPGIMGWHYVFESAPLWCLLFGYVTDRLWSEWIASRRWLLIGGWIGLIGIAWTGMYATLSDDWEARWSRGRKAIQYPRRQHAEFEQWLAQQLGTQRALVLIDAAGTDPHLDLVINEPGLTANVLLGRYRAGQTDLPAVIAAFSDRAVYIARWDRRELARQN